MASPPPSKSYQQFMDFHKGIISNDAALVRSILIRLRVDVHSGKVKDKVKRLFARNHARLLVHDVGPECLYSLHPTNNDPKQITGMSACAALHLAILNCFKQSLEVTTASIPVIASIAATASTGIFSTLLEMDAPTTSMA